eukprot:scaffold115611_cov21-Tisochrysis_lutea.AAC.2
MQLDKAICFFQELHARCLSTAQPDAVICSFSRCTHAACTHCSLMCPMQQNGTETFYGTACLEVP